MQKQEKRTHQTSYEGIVKRQTGEAISVKIKTIFHLLSRIIVANPNQVISPALANMFYEVRFKIGLQEEGNYMAVATQ